MELAAQRAAQDKRQSPPNKDKPSKEQEPPPQCPAKGKVAVYYESSSGAFYALNQQGEYQRYGDTLLKSKLRSAGFHDWAKHTNGLTFLEQETLRIAEEQSVHYAGPLGGYPVGIHEMGSVRCLATLEAKHITPAKGEWPLFKKYLTELLGPEAKYFLAWVKSALEGLEAGSPWSPGQFLAIAGPGGAGKSFLQSMITILLGGRASTPYEYMVGADKFNAEIFGAEHALIGDQNHKFDSKSRKAFGAAIKNLCVNPEHKVRGLWKGGATLSTFIRVTMTLNDNPHSLLALPETDSDVTDKIMLLHARPVELPWPSKRFPNRHAYSEALKAEMPHFLWHLRRWKLPASLYDQRYGVVSYKSKDLVTKMNSLSSEWKFWSLIEMYVFADRSTETWEGTAAELEKLLRDRVKSESLQWLFFYPGACGSYLRMLETQLDGRIEVSKGGHNLNYYWIHRDPPGASL